MGIIATYLGKVVVICRRISYFKLIAPDIMKLIILIIWSEEIFQLFIRLFFHHVYLFKCKLKYHAHSISYFVLRS